MQKHPINSFWGQAVKGGGNTVGRGRGVGGSGAAHQVRGQRKAKTSSVIPCQSFLSLTVLQTTAFVLANRYISLLMK